jgi:hypothetical protein
MPKIQASKTHFLQNFLLRYLTPPSMSSRIRIISAIIRSYKPTIKFRKLLEVINIIFKIIISYSAISNIELNIEIFSRMFRQPMNAVHDSILYQKNWINWVACQRSFSKYMLYNNSVRSSPQDLLGVIHKQHKHNTQLGKRRLVKH